MEDMIGKGWGFPPRFNEITKSVEMASGTQDINESLNVILSTKIGERLFYPDFGCDLSDAQFSPFNVGTILDIKRIVETSLKKYETRITIDDVDVNSDHINEGKLIINVSYTIKATNSKQNMVYPYYFN